MKHRKTKMIIPRLSLMLLILCSWKVLYSQAYQVKIEPYPNLVKADARLILKTGYLLVPENRLKPGRRKVKLPFLFVRRPDQDAFKNVSLYMTGGPGYSTTANIDSISYNSGFLKYGGFIALDQRGTKRALPCLDCQEVQEAVKKSYRGNLDRDSLVRSAVKECRTKFSKQGIDLSAYSTPESVEDINDLRQVLHLDSLNLVGISYSGGLMLSVARAHPEAVKSLILNSPLPGFVNYEEDALLNINEALEQVFENCRKDSLQNADYQNLRQRFQNYFTRISNQIFTISYMEHGKEKAFPVRYGKQELLDVVINRLNTQQVKTVPFVINELLNGNHDVYIRELLDGIFKGDAAGSLGMRYSVYCSEQILYASPVLEQQQQHLLPWLSGYRFNNVDHKTCDCWAVKAVPKTTKLPVYSNVPALISAGDIDPWCRQFFNVLIKRHLPNAQLLLFHNRGHAPGYTIDEVDYLGKFMLKPMQKLSAESEKLKIY
jgi:pimeloyl-ACP methyl ester carboxylesterase